MEMSICHKKNIHKVFIIPAGLWPGTQINASLAFPSVLLAQGVTEKSAVEPVEPGIQCSFVTVFREKQKKRTGKKCSNPSAVPGCIALFLHVTGAKHKKVRSFS
jgi:hypothetical protein